MNHLNNRIEDSTVPKLSKIERAVKDQRNEIRNRLLATALSRKWVESIMAEIDVLCCPGKCRVSGVIDDACKIADECGL